MSYVLTFGKYKNLTVDKVFEENPNYLQWLFSRTDENDNEELYNALKSKLINKNDYYMSWGRHKNKALSWILKNDANYIVWLRGNKYVKDNLVDLYKIVCALDV